MIASAQLTDWKEKKEQTKQRSRELYTGEQSRQPPSSSERKPYEITVHINDDIKHLMIFLLYKS